MTVTAVNPVVSHNQDPMRQQSGLRQDMWSLQQAIASGNLATAQRALGRFHEDLQSIRPAQNGVRASADVSPQATMRDDLAVLQSALDAGDLATAQRAFIRLQQDMKAVRAAASDNPAGQAATALPRGESPSKGTGPESGGAQSDKGGLVDVMG
jgi:peptidoglycan hydrolase CwlO-like protein